MKAKEPNLKITAFKNYLRFFCVITYLILMTACDNNDSANLRVINLSPDVGPIDVFSDDDLLFKAIDYADASDYNSVSTTGQQKSHEFRISPTGSFAVLDEETKSLKAKKDYTFFLFDIGDKASVTIEEDDNSKASSNRLKLRFVHGAPSIISIDVFVEKTSELSQSKLPTLSGQSFKRISEYLESEGGE